MARKIWTCVICAALIFFTLACQLLARQNPAALPSTAVSAALATAPAPTIDTAATISAEAKAAAEATNAAAATSVVQAQLSTQTADRAAKTEVVRAASQTAAVAATAQAQKALAASATVADKATAQAEPIYQLVRDLQAKKLIKDSQGTFYSLKDFRKDWAQLGWYQWWNTGYAPDDFVLSAHTAWESASKTADWYAAGCGFVFRARDENNHYMIYLALDSNVYLKGYVNGNFREMGKGYAGKIDHLKGEADIMLVAQGERIMYFINGAKVLDKTTKDLKQGDLALTLISGTNKDFGTRCAITNIQLWDMTK